jgi:hypothetical protein
MNMFAEIFGGESLSCAKRFEVRALELPMDAELYEFRKSTGASARLVKQLQDTDFIDRILGDSSTGYIEQNGAIVKMTSVQFQGSLVKGSLMKGSEEQLNKVALHKNKVAALVARFLSAPVFEGHRSLANECRDRLIGSMTSFVEDQVRLATI